MKTLLTILLLFFICSSDNYCQNIVNQDKYYKDFELLIDRTKSILSRNDISLNIITDSLELIKNIHVDRQDQYYRYYKILDRVLECGLRQVCYNNYRTFDFNINILLKRDTIIFISFYDHYKGVIYRSIDIKEFQSFKIKHENTYNVKIGTKDTIMLPYTTYEFGYGCGIVGEPTELGRTMIEYVKKRKYKHLKKWSLSMNPEIQAYGVVGLMFLKFRGYKLSISDLDNIEHIQNMSISLLTCQGCQPFIERSMSEELSDEHIKNVYDSYIISNDFGDR